MISAPLTSPAFACAPDSDRAGTVASARLPEWCAHFITAVIRLLFAHLFGTGRRSRVPSWWHDRPDLPPGSAIALAASIRGEFGVAIAWMCRRRGIGPGHPDWPYLARTIVAFGGSVKGARPGLPPLGLQWWENPNIISGMIGETTPTPAADAMASLLSRQALADALPPRPACVLPPTQHVGLPAVSLSQHWPTMSWRRSSTGPPTGPPRYPGLTKRGQPMAGPAVPIRAIEIACQWQASCLTALTGSCIPAGPCIMSALLIQPLQARAATDLTGGNRSPIRWMGRRQRRAMCRRIVQGAGVGDLRGDAPMTRTHRRVAKGQAPFVSRVANTSQ